MPKGSKAKSAAPEHMVALLRGINVGGNKKVPMVELRELAVKAGLVEVATYINSGILLFKTSRSPVDVEAALEAAIAKHFGFTVDVIVRTKPAWAKYAKGSPFPDAASERPKALHLGVSKRAPVKSAEGVLRERAAEGERITIDGDAIWLDFAAGVAKTKLSPAVLDKAVGSTVTARNWTTVQTLAEMFGKRT
jgi:uncharacterized protein (DUF1697 family)